MGLAVAKKKSIDHTFGGKRANDLPEKLESWGPGQVRSIEALEGESRATQMHLPACSLHVDTIHIISTMLCQ
jgi:hypothetical protein